MAFFENPSVVWIAKSFISILYGTFEVLDLYFFTGYIS